MADLAQAQRRQRFIDNLGHPEQKSRRSAAIGLAGDQFGRPKTDGERASIRIRSMANHLTAYAEAAGCGDSIEHSESVKLRKRPFF
jgi:hypothetical protein